MEKIVNIIHFTLYSRSYCHLCEDMLHALDALLGSTVDYTVEVLDVDTDDTLFALYDELVPVLIGKKHDEMPVQLCHYFLDDARIQSFVAKKV